ncbi:MAG: hypothetical protein ABR66_04410 [Microbacteriaceae bacterium BACL25 MAG-120322-bin65]|nr:MAG: hypothetical protein ABR66_04410 [Microbacteriaceae bacterium BACL25 MAG-120322-bin65]
MLNTVGELWRIPKFPTLFVARAVSNLGNGISPVALAFGVLAIPGADAGSLSLVAAARTFPILLLLIFGGAIADRYGRARVMGWSDIVLSVFIASIGIAFITEDATVAFLVVVGLFAGLLNGLWYPAFAGMTPVIVPPKNLQTANATIGFGSNVAFMIGTAVGGITVAYLGIGWAIVVDALTFLIAGLLILPLAKIPQDRPADDSERITIFRDIRDGWGEFSSRPWLVTVVVAWAFINLGFEAAWAVLAPLQSEARFDGPTSWSIVLTSMALGMIVGVALAGKIRPKYPLRTAMIFAGFIPVWLISFAIPLPLGLVAVGGFLAGLGLDLFYVFWMTTIQTQVPPEALSRVNSYDALGSFLFGPLGILLAGPVALLIGVQNALYGAAIVSGLAIASTFLVKSVRNLEGRAKHEGD